MLRRKSLFGCLLALVVLALVISGCGKSSVGNSGNGGNNGNGGNSFVPDFNAFKGVWKSQNITPAVEITISDPIEGSGNEEFLYFTGRVTCNVFRDGQLEITETDDFILGEKYILASIFGFGELITNSILVKAYEEDEDEFGEKVSNEVELDGYLSDANTLKAARLYIREKDKDKYDFDPEDATFITFNKQ